MNDPTPQYIDGRAPETFDAGELLELYRAKRFELLAVKLLDYLTHFERTHYFRVTDDTRYHINELVKNLLYFFTQSDFTFSDACTNRFLELHPILADVIAISNFRNTDAYLKILSSQPNNLARLLVLYNAYNTVRLKPASLFAANSRLASNWYFRFLEKFNTGSASQNAHEQMREHIKNVDPLLQIDENSEFTSAYFGSTYIDPELDHGLKRRINQLIGQRALVPARVESHPNPKKIAVLSAFWWEGHAVHRAFQPYVKSLAEHYDLTLVKLGSSTRPPDTESFEEVVNCRLVNSRLEGFEALNPNDFVLAFYPDIGMSPESILLSNFRIAPIQMSAQGHPVSTFGSTIDYWLSGTETEVMENASERYSERLVLLPGAGLLPVRPGYEPQHPQLPPEPILINCCWAAQKVNYPHLVRLQEIQSRSQRPIKFRFFPGHAVQTGFIPFCRDLVNVLGAEHVEVHQNTNYTEYVKLVEQAHFSLDSVPFGGFSTGLDALFLGMPLVAHNGEQFYNRGAAYLLRQIGLDVLVADTLEDYIDKAVQLADDAEYRSAMQQRVRQADLEPIFAQDGTGDFKAAVDYLIEHHDTLSQDQSREPIVIERG